MAAGLVGAGAEEGDPALRGERSQLPELGPGGGRLEPREVAAAELGPRELAGLPRFDERDLGAEPFEPGVHAVFLDARGQRRMTSTRVPSPDAVGSETRFVLR